MAADGGRAAAGGAGLANTMIWLKEKTEEMVWEWLVLQREREKPQGDNMQMFGKLEQDSAAEALAAVKHLDLEESLATTDADQVA